ncbi:hypothetical protein ABKN59_006032 [Abortiporus biennis]
MLDWQPQSPSTSRKSNTASTRPFEALEIFYRFRPGQGLTIRCLTNTKKQDFYISLDSYNHADRLTLTALQSICTELPISSVEKLQLCFNAAFGVSNDSILLSFQSLTSLKTLIIRGSVVAAVPEILRCRYTNGSPGVSSSHASSLNFPNLSSLSLDGDRFGNYAASHTEEAPCFMSNLKSALEDRKREGYRLRTLRLCSFDFPYFLKKDIEEIGKSGVVDEFRWDL